MKNKMELIVYSANIPDDLIEIVENKYNGVLRFIPYECLNIDEVKKLCKITKNKKIKLTLEVDDEN
jgi:hypothetical protein